MLKIDYKLRFAISVTLEVLSVAVTLVLPSTHQ